MSEPDKTPDMTPASPPDDADVPTAKLAGGSSPSPEPDSGPRPVFDLAEDRCIKCGEKMPNYATICLKCGYDMHANQVRQTAVGTVEVDPAPAPPAVHDFVQPGRLKPKALLILGGLFTVGSIVAAIVLVGRDLPTLTRISIAALALYQIALNTITGVAAVAIVGWLHKQPLGRLELAAARMFAAFACFICVSQLQFRIGYSWINSGLPFLAAVAVYFGVLMILFRKDRKTTATIAVVHLGLWLFLYVGMAIYSLVAGGATTPVVPAKP